MRSPVVAQIVQHLAPGGIETMVLDLQRKASVPDNVHIISLEGTLEQATTNWPRLKGLSRLHFLEKQPGLSFQTVKQLATLLKELNVSVVHTHHVGPLLYGGIAAKLAHCQHTHTEHDAWHLANKKRRLLVGTCFHLLRPTIVADAQLVAENIRQYIPFLQPMVIPNGIDTDRFCPGDQKEARARLKLPADTAIIGCAARFTAVKSHHLLIDAVAGLPDNTHLALAGGGELEETLKQQAKQSGIEHRVHFMGVVEEMPLFYQAIDIFCLASESEGFPLSPIEAQASERVALLTDVGGCREAVDPDSGVLVAHGSSDILREALTSLLKTGLHDAAKQSARHFVLTNANLNRVVEQYERLYEGGGQ